MCYTSATLISLTRMKFYKFIFLNFFRLVLVGYFLIILYSQADGQIKSKVNLNATEIYGGQNGNLFTNRPNLIAVISKDTTATFTIKSSQGIVWPLDKNMFFVDSLKKGKLVLTIFKTVEEKDIFFKKKLYNVVIPKAILKYNSLSISPDISIGGFTTGKVSLDTLKKITSLSINQYYTILNATFYIGQRDLQIASLKSKYFDNELKKLWKYLKPDMSITVDHIEFMDRSGNRYYYPRPITVVISE